MHFANYEVFLHPQAMGNYPYSSSYILNGGGTLPAYPVRVACSHLAEEGLKGEKLLGALAGESCSRDMASPAKLCKMSIGCIHYFLLDVVTWQHWEVVTTLMTSTTAVDALASQFHVL